MFVLILTLILNLQRKIKGVSASWNLNVIPEKINSILHKFTNKMKLKFTRCIKSFATSYRWAFSVVGWGFNFRNKGKKTNVYEPTTQAIWNYNRQNDSIKFCHSMRSPPSPMLLMLLLFVLMMIIAREKMITKSNPKKKRTESFLFVGVETVIIHS